MALPICLNLPLPTPNCCQSAANIEPNCSFRPFGLYCSNFFNVFSALFDFYVSWMLQFEDALNQPDPKEDLRKLIDPRLGESYPIDSVLKVRTACLVHRVMFSSDLAVFFWLFDIPDGPACKGFHARESPAEA